MLAFMLYSWKREKGKQAEQTATARKMSKSEHNCQILAIPKGFVEDNPG